MAEITTRKSILQIYGPFGKLDKTFSCFVVYVWRILLQVEFFTSSLSGKRNFYLQQIGLVTLTLIPQPHPPANQRRSLKNVFYSSPSFLLPIAVFVSLPPLGDECASEGNSTNIPNHFCRITSLSSSLSDPYLVCPRQAMEIKERIG